MCSGFKIAVGVRDVPDPPIVRHSRYYYECDNCNEEVIAEKKISLRRADTVLISLPKLFSSGTSTGFRIEKSQTYLNSCTAAASVKQACYTSVNGWQLPLVPNMRIFKNRYSLLMYSLLMKLLT